MKTLLRNREEALAAHELARSRMTDRQKSTFTPFKKDDRVWLDSPEDHLSQKDETETRRTLQDHRSSRPTNLLITTTNLMENSQCLPCNTPQTLQGKRNLWTELPRTTT